MCRERSIKCVLDVLCCRLQSCRIGYVHRKFEDIANHSFFNGLDWLMLEAQETLPPYKCSTQEAMSVRMNNIPPYPLKYCGDEQLFEGF